MFHLGKDIRDGPTNVSHQAQRLTQAERYNASGSLWSQLAPQPWVRPQIPKTRENSAGQRPPGQSGDY